MSFVFEFRFVLVAALGAWTSSPPLQGQTPERIAGCYSFDRVMFRWSQFEAWSKTSFSPSTSLIELRLEPAESSDRDAGALLVRIPGLRDERERALWDRFSEWRVLPPDSVRISWWNGLSGVTLKLRWHGDTLSGQAVFAFDVGGPGMTGSSSAARPATARRVACPTPPR